MSASSPNYSLKVVIAQCAVIITFLQAAFFEICDLIRTGKDRFCPIFLLVLYQYERFEHLS